MQAIQNWAADRLNAGTLEIAPASSDASFRRYFRVTAQGRDYIVMDAPPAHEDCRPFVAVARLFGDAGVHVPDVLECFLVSGSFDYLVKARLGGMREYRRLLGDILKKLPVPAESHSYVVMEEVKETLALPLDR